MLLRHVSGYFVATAIQVAGSVVLLAALTRLLPPDEYGRYAIAMAVLQIVGGPLFHWVRAILGRFLVNADIAGHRRQLISTARQAMLGCTAAAAIAATIVDLSGLVDLEFAPLLWAVVPALVSQAAFQIETDIHRAELRLERCAILLIAQSVGSVALSLLFVITLGLGAAGAVYGLAISCLLCLAADHAYSPFRARGPGLAWAELRPMLAYSLPLTLIMALELVLQSGDRFVIAGLLSSDAVGAYAAPQLLASRSIQNLCIVVASSSLPLIIAAFEREGAAAARMRFRQAGELMMVALIPTTVAIVVLAKPLTTLLIGPALRDQARQILPIVAIATVFNGLASHYLAHGFQIARRTMREIWAILPAALVGIALDLVSIPRYGVMAAAYALLAAQILYAVLSWILVRPLFSVPLPAWAGARILLPALAAGALVVLLRLPSSIYGLAAGGAIIAVFVGGGILVSDVAGIRQALLRPWQRA